MDSLLRLAAHALQQVLTIAWHLLTANYFRHTQTPIPASHTMKNIVILGGSFAGVAAAHQLLKQPAKTGLVKVTLVTPNTHFYWNVAAPRGLLPGQIAEEQLFQPIADGFAQYSADRFELVIASAQSLDVKAKTVVAGDANVGNKTITYDILILATGSSMKEAMPFKGLGSTEATRDALRELQTRVEHSKTIVIAWWRGDGAARWPASWGTSTESRRKSSS